jgi:glycogen operon protein
MGPTLCFRGIDNHSYYRLQPDDPRRYLSSRARAPRYAHPAAMQLLMDSLRYWVSGMHVDGFRFDLASALARELHEGRSPRSVLDISARIPCCRG